MAAASGFKFKPCQAFQPDSFMDFRRFVVNFSAFRDGESGNKLAKLR